MKTTRPETLPVTENKRRRDRRLEDVILNIMRRHGCRMKLWVIASQAIDELRIVMTMWWEPACSRSAVRVSPFNA
jgi:hypothetical protein